MKENKKTLRKSKVEKDKKDKVKEKYNNDKLLSIINKTIELNEKNKKY